MVGGLSKQDTSHSEWGGPQKVVSDEAVWFHIFHCSEKTISLLTALLTPNVWAFPTLTTSVVCEHKQMSYGLSQF